MLALPNYRILTQLYESPISAVYRGIREKDKQPVILKKLKGGYSVSVELSRYRQEYEITRSFSHLTSKVTGIIQAYSLEYQDAIVLILEDFGGESLTHWLAYKILTVQEFLSLAVAIADSLGQIHTANLIHKNINLDNIVWNPNTNQVKIIDFGIATWQKKETPILTSPNQLEGTLPYLSPEQTGRMNRALDWRTDFYSLGVTFYEMLTGRVPFDSEELELVHCHLAKTPTPVCEVRPEVPIILSNIVMKLMAKNAEDRYQSASGLKADLEKCRNQLNNTGKIEAFSLAQQDFSVGFHIPQKLYGREPEINTLLETFERVSSGAAELMLVAGYSGVGKSALVREVHKPMTSRHGYFASGKFDQSQCNIPYSAIRQACEKWCHYLLTESPAQLQQWREQILAAVGNNGQVLLDLIPQLELVIGPQPAPIPVEPQEGQNRFQRVFQQFCRALCQPSHPFVLFLDDLQWADLASLTLLKSLLTDYDNAYLLIIGAYRDNEVDASHPLMVTLEEIKSQAIVNTITLSNLSLADVNSLVAEALNCEPVAVAALTDLVHSKTQGNAFLTQQFLESLYTQNLLTFEGQTHQWQWEQKQIQAQEPSKPGADLLTRKITHFSNTTQTTLKLAAALGSQFDLETLTILTQKNPQNAYTPLSDPLTEGLVVSLDEKQNHWQELMENPASVHFQFQHDRFRQAAYSLITPSEQPAFHRQIAQQLLANTPIEQLDQRIFAIVNHFNQALPIIHLEAEQFQLAQLNLQAGQQAITAFAFPSALAYLQTAMGLLGNEVWQQHHAFAIQLYTQATKSAFLNVEFEQMEQWGQVVLQHAQTGLERLKIYEIQMEAYSIQNQLDKALTLGLALLKEWDIRFPEEPTDVDIQQALAKTQSLLSQHPQLSDLPQLTAPDPLIIMRILSLLIYVAYIKAPKLLPLLTACQVNLSIKQGNTADSAMGYIVYAGLLCLAEDIETGFQFGKQSLRLVEQFPNFQARIILGFESGLRHWKEHLRDSLKPLLEGYQSGLELGDFLSSGISLATYCMNLYFVGKELTSLEHEIVVYNRSLIQLKQDGFLVWNEITRQAVLNLLGRASADSKLYCLNGEAFNENERVPFDDAGFVMLYLNKLILSYLFHAYPQAVENASQAEQYVEIMAEVHRHLINFYDSLARLAMYPDSSPPEQARILDKVTANQALMQTWSHHAPMNFWHKFLMVEAERCRVLGQDDEAKEFYEKAIQGAQENEYLNEEALAYELAGQFYALRNLPVSAQVHLQKARSAYHRWGAQAKVKDLEERYPQFLAQKPLRESVLSSILATPTGTVMEYSSVTKTNPSVDLEQQVAELEQKLLECTCELQQEILVRKGAEEAVICAFYEVKRLEEVVKRLEEAVKALSQFKRAFLAKMNYELQEPLSVILGYCQSMLQDVSFYSEERQDLEIIQRSGRYLALLINNLLDLSKIESGQMRLSQRNIDLYQLLEEISERFSEKANKRQLKFWLHLAKDVPRYVRTDGIKLRQILSNLLENAFQFTLRGGVSLLVKEIPPQSPPYLLGKTVKTLEFVLKDTGVGIASEELEQLFEAFAHKTGNKFQTGGTGLSLPISRQLVQLLGGDITVSSQVNKGTRFQFTIRAFEVSAAETANQQRWIDIIALAPNQPRYRVLIVAPKWENRYLLKELFNSLGYEPLETSNGMTAIDIWKNWQPHFILISMRMPVMDGLEVTRQIRASSFGEKVVIVAMIANASPVERNQALLNGCDDFLPIPFRQFDILEIMHKRMGVRYVYSTSKTFTPETLTALPDDLLAQIQQAVISADIDLISMLIAKIRQQDELIANELQKLADSFQYDHLLDLIKQVPLHR